MKVETITTEDHQARLAVEVESSSLEGAKHKAARKIARQIKIPGFRPGKAPYAVILRQIGEASLLEEAIELLVQEIYPEIIKSADIEPFGPGSLEKIVSTDPPKFEFLIPLKATVELGDYRAVRENYEPKVVDEEEVQKVIENLRNQNAIIEPADRNAMEGDMVRLRLVAHKVGEEESEPLIRERTLNLLIEGVQAETEQEWPFPEFSRQLIDLKSGDKKQIAYQYDDSSPYETLHNVEALFDVDVIEVRSRTLPEVNDDFAQSIGDYPTITELRQAILADLESQSLAAYNSDFDENVLDKIVEISTINYPPQMLEREIDSVIDNLEDRLEQRGLSLDLYLKSRQIDMQGLREETKPVAETRLKKSLVLLETAEAENIQISPEDLQAETQKTLSEAHQALSQKEYRRLVQKDSASHLVSNIMMEMLIEKTRERVRLIARGEVETPAQPEQSAQEMDVTGPSNVVVEETPELSE